MKTTSLALGLVAAFGFFATSTARAADDLVTEPVKTVMQNYLTIQTNLAADSIKDLGEHASAISKAVGGDAAKTLPAELVKESDTLAAAKDIKAAREAFKPLSASIVKYVNDHKAGKGTYHEVFCPMANANWLQTGKDIKNPYYGKEMLDCGEIKS